MRLIRDISALAIGIVLFVLVPIYGEPFVGCMESGFSTFVSGCSAWPEFLRGFMFMAAIAIIAAHKKSLSAFCLAAVLVVVMAGGSTLIGTGEEAKYFQANYLAITKHISNPLLLGAITALLIYIAIIKIIIPGAANVESA